MDRRLGPLLPLIARLGRRRQERTSLAELAGEAGCSRSHVQRAFRRAAGESPKRFTRRLQLESAAARLLGTEDGVRDVALRVGFDSHEGFTRAFAAHFGVSPRAFRRRYRRVDRAERLAQAEHLRRVGACVRLFRAPLHPTGSHDMTYDFTIEPFEETAFLYQEARCPHAEIGDRLGGILPAVFQYATAEGITMTGPPMTLYMAWGPGLVTLRSGMPVTRGAKGKGEIEAIVLPAGEAAVTTHVGPYDGLGEAHAAAERFVEREGLRRAGPLREVYLTDPTEVPDPAKWQTRVLWPVERG
ncbi:MAG: helix-turn-helix domain-containing protein [Sandaracinaceae bacterium]